MVREEPQVVEAEQVIGVVVRVDDRVHQLHVRAEQLQPQLGRRVDEDVAARRADEHRAAVAVVARVGRLADRSSRTRSSARPTDVPVPRKVKVRVPVPGMACESITTVFHCLTGQATRPSERPGEHRRARGRVFSILPSEDDPHPGEPACNPRWQRSTRSGS